MENEKKTESSKAPRRSLRNGYLAGLSVLAVALAVAVNLVVGQLPSNVTEFDLSSNQLYSISDTSKEYLANLTDEIEIVVLSEEDGVDQRIEKFITRYAALSDKITLTWIDPVMNPSALTEYNVSGSCVVVQNSATGKQETIPFSDMITYDYSSYYYTGQVTESAFDCEGQLTGAIEKVTSDSQATAYLLTNHGEGTFPTQAQKMLDRSNMATEELNLLLQGSIPEDCSLLISYAPTQDLEQTELELVREYLANGGHVMLLEGQQEAALPNWEALLREYGIERVDGYIADQQRFFAQSGSYYAIFPVLDAGNSITAEFGSNDLALVYNSRGYQQGSPSRDTITVSPFMTSSDAAVAVTSDSQTEGTYWLGACASEETDAGTAKLLVFGSSSLIDDSLTTQYSTLVNLTVFTNAATDGIKEGSNLSIPTKSLAVSYNTIRAGGLWGIVFVAVIPVALLLFGLVRWMKRRKQ